MLYVPDLKSNLLSAGQLQEKGYEIFISKSTCENFYPVRGTIAVIKMNSNGLFPLKIESIHSSLMAKNIVSTWLGHYRYGHLSFS